MSPPATVTSRRAAVSTVAAVGSGGVATFTRRPLSRQLWSSQIRSSAAQARVAGRKAEGDGGDGQTAEPDSDLRPHRALHPLAANEDRVVVAGLPADHSGDEE